MLDKVKYAEGEILSFTCKPGYIKDPFNGLIRCGKDGWVKIPSCTAGNLTTF